MKRKVNRELDCCIHCGNVVYKDMTDCCGHSPAKTETMYEIDEPQYRCMMPSEYVAYILFNQTEEQDIMKNLGVE